MNKTIHSKEQDILRGLLKRLRAQKGLRQEDIAERIGEPQSFVSKYEAGERRLDIVELRRICRALGITLPVFAQRFEDELNETR